jgi:hypothetical protein
MGWAGRPKMYAAPKCLFTGCQVLSAEECSALSGTPTGALPSCASVTCAP